MFCGWKSVIQVKKVSKIAINSFLGELYAFNCFIWLVLVIALNLCYFFLACLKPRLHQEQ